MIYLVVIKLKKQLLVGLIVIAVCLSAGFGIWYVPFSSVFTKKNASDTIIVIDAGHGIPDGGAVGVNGTVEEKINLSIAYKVCEILEGKGIKTVMTRLTNDCLCENTENKTIRQIKREDMNNRLDIIKKSNADLFVSIHMNYYHNENVDGLRVFYDKKHEETVALTKYITENIAKVTNNKTYAVKSTSPTLFLMNKSPVPAILIECGFLSNAKEEKLLNDDEYQSKIAWAIASSIEKFYTSR